TMRTRATATTIAVPEMAGVRARLGVATTEVEFAAMTVSTDCTTGLFRLECSHRKWTEAHLLAGPVG
ncbi:MAG TPA: hypothetical protein VIX42_04355, partial [Edaphobacter sp.]